MSESTKTTHPKNEEGRIRPPAIKWYKSKLPGGKLKEFHQRSDAQGFLQSLGHLGILAVTGTSAWLAATYGHWFLFAFLLFLHGTCTVFCLNAVHELTHGTVFKTRRLNDVFASVYALLSWVNPALFWGSHTEHHKYTLHAPSDLEVVLPIKQTIRSWLREGIVNIEGFRARLLQLARLAFGRPGSEWEHHLLAGDENRKLRGQVAAWSWAILLFHATVISASIYFGQWPVALIVSGGAFIGGWLLHLVNPAQHAGLVDYVADFRICCRTIRVHPLVEFLYWRMNYHTEHHMYPGVPCYRLRELHHAIKDDLPEPCNGIIETWLEIGSIMRRQNFDPEYQYVQPLPETARPVNWGNRAPVPTEIEAIRANTPLRSKARIAQPV